MERSKFLEAKKQVDIIDACATLLGDKDSVLEEALPSRIRTPPRTIVKHIIEMIFSDDKVIESFFWWVKREKFIAEEKFNKLT